MVNEYTEDISRALTSGAYYSALALSLAMPDICGFLDSGNSSNRERYLDWFDKWCGGISQWLSAHDCYKLRCAYLHSGRDEIGGMALISNIYFSKPAGALVQKFQHGSAPGSQLLQIPIHQFCPRMCKAVGEWFAARGNDTEVLRRVERLTRIREPDEPLSG